MTSIPFPAIAPLYQRVRAILMLLVFVGLLSFVAVLAVGIDCHKQQSFLLLENGGYLLQEKDGRIALEKENRQCEFVSGELRLPLPAIISDLVFFARDAFGDKGG